MSKVICDICGTTYPESAANCPVCGSSREYALGSVEDDFLEETAAAAAPRKTKEIFDYDEVNQVKAPENGEDEDDFEDEEVYEEERRTNVGLVIFLVILIVLLLLAAGFFFLRYLLPNMTQDETVPVQTTAAVIQTETVATTDVSIPCTNLMMDGGKMELGKDGKKLLNVRVYPADTTDALIYTSGDEAVVTVSEEGTVTAVGEGTTVITVQCGSQQIKCNVTVSYASVDVTVPEGGVPGLTVDETLDATAPQETGEGAQETQATEAATEPTETTEQTTPPDAVLKLKKTDITISFLRTSVTLELDCDINPEDVTWFTMDSSIAIVNDGVVTSIGRGTTKVYAEYKDQQVACIVRCN